MDSVLLRRANSLIGKSFINCSYAVAEVVPEYRDLLIPYADPSSDKFNRRRAFDEGKSKMIKLDTPKDGAIAAFIDNRGFFGHVGIYIKGYIYHYQNDSRFLSTDSDIILNTMKFCKIEYYINEEIINDYIK